MNFNRVFSRRQMILAGGATVALPCIAIANGLSESGDPSLSTSDRSVSVVSPGNPIFSSEIDKLFPGLRTDPQFLALMPLSAIIKHHNGPAIRAYTPCWSITTPSGNYETALFRFAPPGSKRRDRKGRTIASAQTDLLRAGESRLITPYFTLSPDSYKNSTNAWHALVTPKEPAGFLASEIPTATKIAVSIDAVIFKDRKIVGPDRYHLARRLRATRNAEHDMAFEALKLLKAGNSDAEIEAALMLHGSKPRTNFQGSKGWYHQNRKHHAQILVKKLHSLQRDRFTKAVTRLVKMHKTVFKKVDA